MRVPSMARYWRRSKGAAVGSDGCVATGGINVHVAVSQLACKVSAKVSHSLPSVKIGRAGI